MIQRIQSVFLLIAAIVLSTSFFFKLWEASSKLTSIYIKGFNINKEVAGKIIDQTNNLISPILTITTIIIALVSIFLFNNRLLQIKITYAGIIGSIAIIGSNFMAIGSAKNFFGIIELEGTVGLSYFMPIFSLICFYLAQKYIKKDEALVRSVDRLR